MQKVSKNVRDQVILGGCVLRGLFRPGLAQLVRRVVVQHLRGNREFRLHRYPPIMRLARLPVTYPRRALALILSLYAAVWSLGEFGWLDGYDLANDSPSSTRDFWVVNIGLLGAQATLVGLVFPLVIAFVGLLSQGRASFASRLTTYVDSSNATRVGVSSLLLCVAIAAQLPLAERIGEAHYAFTLLNMIWFGINAVGLAHFVLHTIAFVHPGRRPPIIRAYVANVVWPRELTAIATINRWAGVVEYGYLPAGDAIDQFETSHGARVWYMPGWNSSEPRVFRRLRGRMTLIDVRHAVLAPVIRDWLAKARGSNDEQTHDFVIPLRLGSDYEGEQVLARATLPLSPVARLAVRIALRFRKTPANDGAIGGTEQILSEMVADLIALVDTRQASEFNGQFRDVIEFLEFLYRLAQCPDEDFNYAQLQKGLLTKTLGQGWANAYLDLIRRAVERLPDETEFVSTIAYTPARIYRRAGSAVTPKALHPTFLMIESLASHLMNWARAEIRYETTTRIGSKRAFTLSRHGENYTHAWRELVAGWESLFEAITAGLDRRQCEGRSWNDLKTIAEIVGAHLSITTRMTARAVWLGDLVATNWTCDLILHWETQSERTWNLRRRNSNLQTESFTFDTLKRDWAEVERSTLTLFNEPSPSLIVGSIVKNAWQDHLIGLANVCIHWAIHAVAEETGAKAARMLLRGEPYDRGGTGGRQRRGLSPKDLLVSALRVAGAGEPFDEKSYAGQLNDLINGLRRLHDPPMLPGRPYFSRFGPAFETLAGEEAIAMIATTRGPQNIDGNLRRLLTQSEDQVLRRREDRLERLLASFDQINLESKRRLIDHLVNSEDGMPVKTRRCHARKLVENSLGVLRDHRKTRIVEAEIDQERIRELSKAAGSQAFQAQTFPLNFFAQIVPTSNTLAESTITVTGVPKGAYTSPLMAQAMTDETDWWKNAVADRAAAAVWREVLKNANFQEIDGRTPEAFWHAVRDGSARIRREGNQPFLVISEVTQPEWLDEWSLPYLEGSVPKPTDLVITREERRVEGYAFNMNDTPVYYAEPADGVAYLVPAQLLSSVRYHDFGEGQPICLRFVTDTANPWQGTMHATFQCAVELSELKGYRIKWTERPDASGRAKAS